MRLAMLLVCERPRGASSAEHPFVDVFLDAVNLGNDPCPVASREDHVRPKRTVRIEGPWKLDLKIGQGESPLDNKGSHGRLCPAFAPPVGVREDIEDAFRMVWARVERADGVSEPLDRQGGHPYRAVGIGERICKRSRGDAIAKRSRKRGYP